MPKSESRHGRRSARSAAEERRRYDVLETTTYNAQHLPLTTTDTARQTTTFTYRTTGDPETIIIK